MNIVDVKEKASHAAAVENKSKIKKLNFRGFMNKKTRTISWRLLPLVYCVTAIIMTLYEYIKELFFAGSLTPWESHTITIIVTSFIATITAAIIRSWVHSVYELEKEVELKRQSLISFELILSAVNHIVNNVLNYLQLVKVDIDNNKKVSDDTLLLLEESIKEASNQMKILNKIQRPDDPDSYKDIYPG